MNRWVVCGNGRGYLVIDGMPERYETSFNKGAVGLVKEEYSDSMLVWLIGTDNLWKILLKHGADKVGDKLHI
jgi:hypothetical protein